MSLIPTGARVYGAFVVQIGHFFEIFRDFFCPAIPDKTIIAQGFASMWLVFFNS